MQEFFKKAKFGVMSEISFSELNIGDNVEITGYHKGNDPAYRSRILALGLLKGTAFSLTKVAPMGDPVEVSVRGYRLSLRRKEADLLKIRKI